MKQLFAFGALVGLSVVLSMSSCSTFSERTAIDTTYTITVNLTDLDTGTLILNYAADGEAINDTARSTNGTYAFTGKSPEPKRAWLRIDGLRTRSLIFFMENGQIAIRAHRDSLSDGTVSGTKTNDENEELSRMLAATDAKYDALMNVLNDIPDPDQATLDSLEKEYNKIEQERKEVTSAFVKTHPASFASAYQLSDIYGYNPDVAQFEQAFNLLDTSLLSTTIGKQVSEQLETAKRTDINQIAPDFTMNDVNGTAVALSSLRGKYVLLDFWASWCGPCREENPNLVRSYKEYNKLGFEVVGVSLDFPGEREKWLAAIKKDQLTWLQLSDLQGWKSSAAKLYGIMGIPMNYLLDKDGRIVAKGLRGASLDEKLASLLKGS